MCFFREFLLLVEIKGVEPLTSCLQGRRSSQLSYIPIYKIFYFFALKLLQKNFIICIILVVGSNGIEPSTSRLSGVRSNHLSYEPIF